MAVEVALTRGAGTRGAGAACTGRISAGREHAGGIGITMLLPLAGGIGAMPPAGGVKAGPGLMPAAPGVDGINFGGAETGAPAAGGVDDARGC